MTVSPTTRDREKDRENLFKRLIEIDREIAKITQWGGVLFALNEERNWVLRALKSAHEMMERGN